MKRNRIFSVILAMAAIAAASCSKDEIKEPGKTDPDPQKPEGVKEYVLNISKADKLSGEITDGIGFYSASEISSCKIQDGKAAVLFANETSGEEKVSFYFPASAELKDGMANFSIPGKQTQEGSDFDFTSVPMVSAPVECKSGTAVLHSLVSAINFKIAASEPEKIKSVTFNASAAAAGRFSVNLPAVNPEVEGTLAISGMDIKSVTTEITGELTAEMDKAAEVHVIVAPGSYMGTVSVTTESEVFEFELSEVVDAQRGEEATVNLAIKKAAKSLKIDTAVPYNILDLATSEVKAKSTMLVSKADFDGKTGFGAKFTDESVEAYFKTVEDENIVLLGGYIEKGAPDYGYTSIAVVIYDEEDSAHPGCKRGEMLSTNLAATLCWDKYTSTPGTVYYNPSDGAVTIENCAGHLGWGYDFNWNRRYVPADDIELSEQSVSLKVEASKEVSILYSNGECAAVSAEPTVATASISGNTVTITGVAEGKTTVTVSDTKGKKAEIAVSVKAAAQGGIATDITYDITLLEGDSDFSSSYKPKYTEREIKGVYFCTRADYIEKAPQSDAYYNAKDPFIIRNYFDLYTDDDLTAIGGYIGSDGKANYAYLAIIIRLTDEDAPADGGFKGCKVVNVEHSVPCASEAAGLDWYKGQKYESCTGTGYYNPADGSITLVNVKGKKAGKEFCINRRYTPSEK